MKQLDMIDSMEKALEKTKKMQRRLIGSLDQEKIKDIEDRVNYATQQLLKAYEEKYD